MTQRSKEEFNSIIEDITKNKKFNKLNKQLHHGISRYEHSMRVAKWTYNVTNFFHMKNKEDTTRAALLHDFYVDEDLTGNSVSRLGTHPNAALENSLKYYKLTNVQQDIIKSHMFPCTMVMPKYKESWLVSGVDKVVSTYEMLTRKVSLYLGIYLIFMFEVIRIPR